MKLFLIIAIFVLFVLYLPPTVRFVAKRTAFAVKILKALKSSGCKKYGRIFFVSRKRTAFYVETDENLFSVILFPCFYKNTMLHFNLKGNLRVMHLGVRRIFPFGGYYDLPLNMDFRFKYDTLPTSCKEKPLIPVLLFNPVPSDITVPGKDNYPVFIGSGEYVDKFCIMDGRYFADQIVKGVRFSEMSQ